MKPLNKILIIGIMASIGLTMYAGSALGWGIGGLEDKKTKEEIQQNCPNYYTSRSGDCLGTTFRSYYLMRGLRGGSFSGGGK